MIRCGISFSDLATKHCSPKRGSKRQIWCQFGQMLCPLPPHRDAPPLHCKSCAWCPFVFIHCGSWETPSEENHSVAQRPLPSETVSCETVPPSGIKRTQSASRVQSLRSEVSSTCVITATGHTQFSGLYRSYITLHFGRSEQSSLQRACSVTMTVPQVWNQTLSQLNSSRMHSNHLGDSNSKHVPKVASSDEGWIRTQMVLAKRTLLNSCHTSRCHATLVNSEQLVTKLSLYLERTAQ